MTRLQLPLVYVRAEYVAAELGWDGLVHSIHWFTKETGLETEKTQQS